MSAPFFRVPNGGFITTVSTIWPRENKGQLNEFVTEEDFNTQHIRKSREGH